jgi:hypothetical protein
VNNVLGALGMRTFSSERSYGKLATMTLFLDGIPSAGGPRSRRSRGGRSAWVLAPFVSVLASVLVVSVKGRTSVVAGASAPSSPRLDCYS